MILIFFKTEVCCSSNTTKNNPNYKLLGTKLLIAKILNENAGCLVEFQAMQLYFCG
jgi:hypothetical protein